MARIRPDLMMIDGEGSYEALANVIAQAVAVSPVVVDTPSGVKPSAIEALKVAEQVVAAVAPIIAPDVSDSKLTQLAKQVTTAVVTAPEVIATPTGKTVNTTTLQGIIEASKITPTTTGKKVDGGIMLDDYNPETGVMTSSQPDPAKLASLSGKRLTESDGDAYYTAVVGSTGKTSAQLDAADNAKEVAKSTGGTFDKETGYVFAKGTSSDAIQEFKDAYAAAKDAGETPPLPPSTVAAINAANEVIDLAASITPASTGQTVTTPLTGTSSAGMAATSYTNTGKFGGFETALEQQLGRDIGSSVNYNAMIDQQVAQAQSVAAKPVMSAEQKAGGGEVKWIGGVSGKWEIVMPIGSPLVGSKAAGWEPGRNPVGVQSGVSPTGIIPGAGATVSAPVPSAIPATTTTVTTTPTTTAVTTTPVTSAVTSTPTTTTATPTVTTSNLITNANTILPPGVTVTSTYIDPKTGDTVGVLSNGTTKVLSAGDTLQTNRVSTMNTLIDRFNKYGLSTLANKIKELAIDGATESTITLQLQETPEYQQRFSANAARIKQGLQVLNPAEYLSLEDGYRQVLRAYGLKAFDTDAYVQQFIANDVSAAELSNRVVTAVQRVQNADPAVQQQLRDYYGIGQQDLVAYVLDPQQQFQKIERQVAASEIGVAAGRQGLKPGVAVAEQLAAQGVTQAEAQKGYATIADILPTAEKLSSIYGKTMDTYGQSEAEQEVFNSLASAQRKREKLTARELASFSGAAGTNKTSLTTSSVGQF